jgi:hypothetical protein
MKFHNYVIVDFGFLFASFLPFPTFVQGMTCLEYTSHSNES